MDSTLTQPFVDETIRTLASLLGVTAEKVGEEKKTAPGSTYELSGTVGMSGSATGGVVLSAPWSVACQIASKMLGRQVDEQDPEVKDVVGELVNMVTARAKQILEKKGLLGLRFSLPRVVVGKGRNVWLARELPCLSTSIVAKGIGQLSIEVSIQPTAQKQASQATPAELSEQSARETPTPERDAGGEQSAMKILLVDDSAIVRQLVADIVDGIDDIPIELTQATTGPEALEAAREHGSSLDLILCDIGIPEIEGLTVLEEVKTATDARAACFVVISGDTSAETVARAIKDGAAGFLVKPFSRDEVVKLIRAVRLRSTKGLPTSTSVGLPLVGLEPGTSGPTSSSDSSVQDGEV